MYLEIDSGGTKCALVTGDKVPESKAYKIQKLHLPVYYAVCAECERMFFYKINIKNFLKKLLTNKKQRTIIQLSL